jgi:GTPase SAR1 family protein
VSCGDEDILEVANKETYKILIIGKPRCGKTTIAKALS